MTAYLLNTCDKELKTSVVKEDPEILTRPESQVIAAIKRLAVVNIATSVLQTELITLTQNQDEPIRHFAARARGKAKNCKLTVVCSSESCTQVTSYSEDVVKMVLLTGMADEDIKREVLGTEDLDTKDLNTTVGLIETKETATRSLRGANLSLGSQDAITGYKKVQ